MACLFLKGKMMSVDNPKRSLWARLVPQNELNGRAARIDEIVVQVIEDSVPLRTELEGRLERLKEDGVVSISVNFQKGSMSTFEGLSVLNNVICQYEEGAGEVKTISPKPISPARDSDPDLTP